MNIELRDPNIIMKLSRLGSFHQSKLSFLRSFLNEFKSLYKNNDLLTPIEAANTLFYNLKKIIKLKSGKFVDARTF